MSNIQTKRLKSLQRQINSESLHSAIIISPAAVTNSSRDTEAAYRQSSDFFYLTGTNARNCHLFLAAELKRPVLIAQRQTATEILWNGPEEDPKKLARQLGADLEMTDNPRANLLERVKGIEQLFFQTEAGLLSSQIKSQLIEMESHLRGRFPFSFKHSDVLLAPLRMQKDASEIRSIRHAGKIAAESLLACIDLIRPGIGERQIAERLEAELKLRGAEPSFLSIAATGPSAAVLHYHALSRKLKSGELFMLDFGARANAYCSDITRTFPVSGVFTSKQKDLYQLVLEAQKAAIATVKSGVLIRSVHEASTKVITQGLIDLKIIKGPLKTALKNKRFLPFFPHGIGHQLGLDVHDITLLSRADPSAKLQEGMVFTIEPGLYFQKAVRDIPASGIRIEDDVLVKKSIAEILTPELPKEVSAVENLLIRK